MTPLIIWHNPRCSKSRQTLALLEQHGAQPVVRRYLDDSPDAAEILAVLAALGKAPIDIMRSGEAVFKQLGLARDSADEVLIQAMAAHPILIERPIVIAGDKAAMGRPPEAVLSLLES